MIVLCRAVMWLPFLLVFRNPARQLLRHLPDRLGRSSIIQCCRRNLDGQRHLLVFFQIDGLQGSKYAAFIDRFQLLSHG